MGVSKTQVVKFIRKGDKGEQGATMRGPQIWQDCADGYYFQSGAPGDAWKDVVLYNGDYYSCVKSHTKSTFNYPGSSADRTFRYWQLGDKIELVATKILLAAYALVENLGVTAIEMKDNGGNVLFRAKDGNVTCKTGTFENVTVRGRLDGVTGSFKNLICLNASGESVGGISFNWDGQMTFDGDIVHQGYNSEGNRRLRFYTADVWCRGKFGAAERNTLVVCGNYGYYHTKGLAEDGIFVLFAEKKASNGETYYTVPLYGTAEDYAGFPVDTVIFKIVGSSSYQYELQMRESQRVLVVNAVKQNNARIYANGRKVTWNGGEMTEVVKLESVLYPPPAGNRLGNGLMVGAFRVNDW